MYIFLIISQKKLETILAEPSESTSQNGTVFDREAYLREEGFEEVEVVVQGRNSVKLDRKSVSLQLKRIREISPYEFARNLI